jgi:hypothetical protein
MKPQIFEAKHAPKYQICDSADETLMLRFGCFCGRKVCANRKATTKQRTRQKTLSNKMARAHTQQIIFNILKDL